MPSKAKAAVACGPRGCWRSRARSCGVALRISALQLEPVPRTGAVRPQDAVLGLGNALEEQALVTHAPQPVEVVRRYRLLEPLDAELLRVDPRPFDRFLTCERAVRVDEELRVLTDRLPRRPSAVTIAAWLAPDLHLHPWDSLLRPTAELLLQLRVRGRREATDTVDRHP